MKSTKVLMVQPKTPQTFWSHHLSLKAAGFKTVMPPLGLMTVAAMLPPHYDVKLVDLNVADLDVRDIQGSDLVFLTGMWIHQESFVDVVRLAYREGKTLVAGGPLVQSAYDMPAREYLELDKIHHLVLAEAEEMLPDFIRDFEAGRAQKVYHTKEKPDLSLTPPPRFDLIRPQDYFSMSLQFSRGCPFNCEFCDIIQMFGHVPRTKSTEQFMREVEALYATGYRGRLFIVDDNFTANRKAVKAMLRHLAEWQEKRGYPYLLFTEASIDLAGDEELLALMVRSGFTSVFIGIESPDETTLRAAHKNMNLAFDMNVAIEKIQRAGMEVMGGFILGFDTDAADVFERQLKFIHDNGIVQSMVGLLTAMPHTDLHKRLAQEGRLLEKNECRGDNVDTALNFVPKMPPEKLIGGYRWLIAQTYTPGNYFQRATKLLSRLPDMRLSTLYRGEPWRRKLALSKITVNKGREHLIFKILKVFASAYGVRGLVFVLKSLRFGLLTLPLTLELTFRGLHYVCVAKRITQADTRGSGKDFVS